MIYVTVAYFVIGAVAVVAAFADNTRAPRRVIDATPRDSFFTFSTNTDTYREVARLGPGGCIRGPFWIKNDQGVIIFRLEKNDYYPAGCEGAPR